jgi:hypothetical protein
MNTTPTAHAKAGARRRNETYFEARPAALPDVKTKSKHDAHQTRSRNAHGYLRIRRCHSATTMMRTSPNPSE